MADLTYRVDIDTRTGIANLQRLNRSLNETQNNAERTDSAFKTFGKSILSLKTALVGLVGSAGFGALIKSGLASADALGKVADKVGLTTNQLQELRFVAEQSGVAASALDTSMQRFSRRVGEAASGTGVLKNILQDLNINIYDSNGAMRSVNDLFTEYMSRVEGAATQQEKLRLAVAAFDMEGAAMVNMLKDGVSGMNAMRQEAQGLGIIISRETIDNAERANDAWNKVKKQFVAIGQIAASKLAKPLENAADKLNKFLSNKESIDKLVGAFENLADKINTIIEFVSSVSWGALFSVAKWTGLALAINALSKVIYVTNQRFGGFAGGLAALRTRIAAAGGVTQIFAAGLKTLGYAMKALGWTVLLQALFDFKGFLADITGLLNWLSGGSFKWLDKLADRAQQFADSEYGLLDLFGGKVKWDKDGKIMVDTVKETLDEIKQEYERTAKELADQEEAFIIGLSKGPSDFSFDSNKLPSNVAMEEAPKLREALTELRAEMELPLDKLTREYHDTLKTLAEALNTFDPVSGEALITQEEYNKLVAQVAEAYKKAADELDPLVKAQKELQEAQEDYNKDLKKTVLDLAKQGDELGDIKRLYTQINEAKAKGLVTDKEAARAIKEVDKQYKQFQKDQLDQSRKWEDGWTRAFNEYVDEATNAAKQAEDAFRVSTQAMEDAIVQFAKTGKFEWKSFLSSIVDELLRSQARQLVANIFGGLGGSSGGFAGFFANGGTIPSGQFGIVGEAGPELVQGPANVTPLNGLGGGAVTYNINAVDAYSFKQMVARDPQFLFAVTEEGRRGLPARV